MSRHPSAAPACPGRPAERGGIILKLLKWIFLLVVMVTIYLLRGPILRAAGEFWIVEDTRAPADAIVILGDDNYAADRAARAAELFREGWAPRIVACGRYLRPYASLAELMERDLTARGVPAQAVVRLASLAGNTREEAVLVRRLADRQHWKRLLVVTSNYHTRRARYIYRRVFQHGPEVRVVSARDSGYDPDNWWQSRQGRKAFFLEFAAFPVAVWETRSIERAQRGLNDRDAPAPGATASPQPTLR